MLPHISTKFNISINLINLFMIINILLHLIRKYQIFQLIYNSYIPFYNPLQIAISHSKVWYYRAFYSLHFS
jgi:hypothetical protein